MSKKAKGADTQKQEDMHFMSFHGTESHQSVLDLFLSGKGPCFAAFEKIAIEVNRAGNDCRAKDGHMLELKPLLHRDPNGRLCVYDPGFTRDAIRYYKEGQLITGRILYDKALQVVANYKHALKHYNSFVDATKNEPSGTALEDMIDWVLRKMCVEFKGGRVKPTGRAGRNRAPVEEEDMPPTYIFNGFFAFLLFGPRPLSSHPFGCLSVNGKGVEKKGRNAIRQEEAKDKAAERAAGTDGYVPEACRRGVSLTSKTSVAQLAAAEHSDHSRNLRELLNGVIHDARNALDEHRIISEQIKEAKEDGDHALLTELRRIRHSLVGEMAACRDRKREHEKQMNEHLQKKPRQLEALYDQVGCFKDGGSATTGTSTSTPGSNRMVINVDGRDDASRLTEDGHNAVVDIDNDDDSNEANNSDNE